MPTNTATALPMGIYRISLFDGAAPTTGTWANIRIGPRAGATITGNADGTTTISFDDFLDGRVYVCASGTPNSDCKIPGSALYSIALTTSPMTIRQGMTALDAAGNTAVLPAGSYKLATFDGVTFVKSEDNLTVSDENTSTGNNPNGSTSSPAAGAASTALLPNPAKITPKFGKRKKVRGKTTFVLLKKAVVVTSGARVTPQVTFTSKSGKPVNRKLGKAKVRKKSGKVMVKLLSRKPMRITLSLTSPAESGYDAFSMTKVWVLK